jgi:formylglycine-generating enzyme required for sulfatase activity
MDMVGNVGEWCADGPGPTSAFIKGGAWISSEIVNLRPAARNMSGHESNAGMFYGFRCARSLG